MTLSLLLLIALALVFDFLNGFHDSANSIATIVSTRVLSPRYAVIWAAFFNFIAFLFFGLHVANTIGKGIIDIAIVDKQDNLRHPGRRLRLEPHHLVLRPAHQLLPRPDRRADRRGAGQGRDAVPGLERHPEDRRLHLRLAGDRARSGLLFGIAVYWLFQQERAPEGGSHLPEGPVVSAALYSLGHGGNDAQKTMGIIASLLFSAGLLGKQFHIPCGSCSVATRPSPWAPCSAAGASSRPWGRRWPSSGRWTASAPSPGPPSPCSSPPARHPGEHHPHHHRRHHGRRLSAAAERGALGRGRPDRLGLDPDDPVLGGDLRPGLLRSAVRSQL